MRRFLFLYLALACFLTIVIVFVFDGYLGVYDSVSIKTGEFTQEIAAGSWPEGYPYQTSSQADQKIFFSYRVDNRWFTTHRTTVSASLWQENQRITGLTSETLEVKAFKEDAVEWTLDPASLELGDFQQQQFTVRIERDDIVREIITSFYRLDTAAGEIKVIPTPAILR